MNLTNWRRSHGKEPELVPGLTELIKEAVKAEIAKLPLKYNIDADEVDEVATKKWAAETGADVTSGHTAATVATLTGLDADDLVASASRKWAGETGADVTGSHTAASITSQGALATKNAVDLSTAEVTNKTAANIAATATRKWAGATGADFIKASDTLDSITDGTSYVRLGLAAGDYDLSLRATKCLSLIPSVDDGPSCGGAGASWHGMYTYYLLLPEAASTGSLTNYGVLCTKSDNKLYFTDGGGTVHEVAFVA